VRLLSLLLALALLITSCIASSQLQARPTPVKAHCHVHGALPDPVCTPGAIFPVTKEQVCKPGYARSVRNVPTSVKAAVFLSYGIRSHRTGEWEVDHLISLELGGSNAIMNLWPEAAKPVPGFHEKDKVENYLHAQVCSGKMTLAEAQREIATNWLAVYQKM
jgi:hypothetical protein